MKSDHFLSHEQARTFYDRFGSKQDAQGFYENQALAVAIEHGDFEHATSVLEFGCGTGRFAEALLNDHLPPDAKYRGVDVSATMVSLARSLLAPFGDRAKVDQVDGTPRIEAPDASVDRFVSNYVMDILSPADITGVLVEARRLLRSNGRLCIVNLTNGTRPVSHFITSIWAGIHSLRPSMVGGCRPLDMTRYVDSARWEVGFHDVVVAFGVPSEILVATPVKE